MLYQLHELHQSSLLPVRLAASANVALFGNPFSPLSYSPMGRWIAASSALVLRMTQRYAEPDFGLSETRIDGKAVEGSEERVLDKPFASLLHFRRATAEEAPRVLVVAPLSGHFS